MLANFNGATWSLDADILGVLTSTQDANGNFLSFSYLNSLNETESYDASGNLRSITDKNGLVQAITRDATTGRIVSVQDPSGRSLVFSFDANGRIQQLTQPDGGTIRFAYDGNNNLQAVTYPDQKFVQYNYNESAHTSGASLPNALTSVVDENSKAYTTYSYDTTGRGIGNYHGSGVASYTISYTGGTSVTTPLGSVETPLFQASVGVNRLYQLTETCAGCNAVTTQYTYASNGHVQTETDRNGNVSAYLYNANLPLTTQRTDAQGQSAQRITQTDWNTTLLVPTEKRVLESNSSVVNKTDFVYNTRGQVLSRCEIDPTVSGASNYTCGSSTNAPTGVRQWRYAYCEQADVNAHTCSLVGLLTSVDGPRTDVSDVTTYTYFQSTILLGCANLGGTCHNNGDLQKVTNALGQATTYFSYDKNGRITRMQDANGTYTDMTYHARGWLLTRTVRANANGTPNATLDATTTFAYDNVGNVVKVTQPDGAYLNYTYDAAHRLTDITDNLSETIHYTLDAAGNRTDEKTKVVGGNIQRELSRQYDQLNRLTKILNATNTTVQTFANPAEAPPAGIVYTDGYDGNGNPIYSVDGTTTHVGTEQQYDPLNRLVKTLQDHAGTGATRDSTTQYAYDTRSNLRSVIDPDSLTTSYTYDGLNNLTALSSPDTGNTGYTYDAAGNRATQIDARLRTTTFNYDVLNRLTGIGYQTTSLNVTYAYDQPATGCYNVGRLTRITDSSGNTTYCYDQRGNVLSKVQITSGTTLATGYTYTLADRLASITYPSGAIVSYSRNSVGQATNVSYKANATATPVTVISSATYLPFGPLNVLTFGNGRTLTKAYDSNYAIDQVVSSSSSASRLVIDGAVDVLGNLINASSTIPANPPTQQYQYDPLYRLTNVQNGSGTSLLAFSYDLTGDRLTKTPQGQSAQSYTYAPATHHLASVAGVARSYDNVGNTASIGGSGKFITSQSFTYDDRNRLSHFVPSRDSRCLTCSQITVDFNYNGRGERVVKTVTSTDTQNHTTTTTTRFVYGEAGQLLSDGSDYIYLDSTPIAYVPGKIYYIESDQLGTPRQVINPGATTAADTLMWKWDYFASNSAFGENTPSVQTLTFNLRFPGQYFDSETGLNYNYFRDYEAGTGRYVESDPIGLPGGPNTYAYATNNPILLIDPLGLLVQRCCRQTRVTANLIDHCWLKTDLKTAGMNSSPKCSLAGDNGIELPWLTDVYVSDHSCETTGKCEVIPDVDEQCVNKELEIGKYLGRFGAFNNCQTFAWAVLTKCSKNPKNPPRPESDLPPRFLGR